MKNVLSLAMLCLFFTVNLLSQTTEPAPMIFNWGSYTAPFHDSSHKITKPVLGWQWGYNDSSFDAYIGANMTHGGGAPFHYAGAKNGMRTILEYHGKTYGGHRYDAEIVSNLRDNFRPYRYDSSGAIYGWLWRNTSISQRDTATPNKPYGAVKINGSGLVLKNMAPNRGYGRAKINSTPEIGQLWYLSIHLRRTDSTNTDTTDNPALSLRIKYWARNLSDNTKLPRNDFPIIFDSIPGTPTWHSRGYWDGKCTYPNPLDSTRTIIITRKMLPLHGISGRTPDVTLSAYFRLTDWNKTLSTKLNPITSFGLDNADLAEGNYHIDSLSVEVTGYGFPTTVDFIRLEEPDHRKLLRGEYDNTIHTELQNYITDMRTYAPQVKVQGISPAIEYRWWSLSAFRYLARLVNGYAFADPNEINHSHIRHAIGKTKAYWQWGRLHSIDNNVAAPWFPRFVGTSDTSCHWGRHYAFGYDLGYLVNSVGYGDSVVGTWANFGDTTKSFYETAVHRCTYGSQHEYMTRSALQALDTMSLANFIYNTSMDWFSSPRTFQIMIDNKLAKEELSYGKSNDALYSEQPWWSQFLIHSRFELVPTICPTPSVRASYEAYKRMNTGEELRYLFWADIIRGAKGIMIDNGGIVRMTTSGEKGAFTLRKVQQYNTLYDPDNPNDGDFILPNDSTYLSKYINRSQIAQLCGIDSTRIYLGTKSARLSAKYAFDFMNTHADEVMRLRLVSSMTKGYKSFYSGDTATMGRLFRYKVNNNQTGVRLRPLGRTLSGNPYYEPKDSTFYDLSLLRDKNDGNTTFDSVFYIGICNRRTDPLRMVRTPISDTTQPKRLKFLSYAEYIDSCKVSPDSVLWKNQYWTQIGAREITIPFKAQYHNGSFSLLRIQDMNGTLDTIIGSDRALSLRMLPGEGKILRIRPIKTDTSINGILAHSNQRKLISFPIPVYNSSLGKYVPSLDSIRYYLTYFRPVGGGNNRTMVCYRRSKTAAFNTPSANVQWENEIVLSNSYIHPTRTIVNDTCAYPSILLQYDTTSTTVTAFVVYGCKGYMPPPPPSGQERYQRIVQSRIVHLSSSSTSIISRVIVDSVYSDDLAEYGTPMIAGSDQYLGGTFYTWAHKKRGIGIGWNPTGYTSLLAAKKYIRFHPDTTSVCPTVWKAQHPSLSTYVPVRQKGRDCALAWQENYSCSDNRAEIFTTRIKAVTYGTGQYGVLNYLGPKFENAGNYSYFNADSSILCLSNSLPPIKDTNRLGNYFPMPWRELALRDTCSVVPLSAASRIRMDAFIWQQLRPSLMFSPSSYTRLLLGGLVHPDTLIGGAVTPIRTSILTKTILSHYPYGDVYFPSISQGTANVSSDSYSLQAEGCLNSSSTSLIINAIETNEVYGGTYVPVYIHQELSHTPFAFLAPQKYIAETKFGSYIHLAGMTFAHSPYIRWEHRRVYNHRPTTYTPTDVPQILASAQYFYKRNDDYTTSAYMGWNDSEGHISLTAPLVDNIPVLWNTEKQEQLYSIRADTLKTEWFRVRDLTRLEQKIKGYGWNALQVWLQKKGEQPQRLPYAVNTNDNNLGVRHRTELLNGDNEEYRLLFARGTETARFEREIRTERHESGLEKGSETSIDVSTLSRKNASLTLYPNPTSDELTILWTGGKALCQFINSEGNIISEQTITGNITLNTQEVPNGLYIVRLQQGGTTINKQIIILK